MTERQHLIQSIQRALPYAENGMIHVSIEAAKEIVGLLEKQEPKLPKVTENAYGRKFYFCPHCKRPILKSGIIGRPRHCEDCGQAVKWE